MMTMEGMNEHMRKILILDKTGDIIRFNCFFTILICHSLFSSLQSLYLV